MDQGILDLLEKIAGILENIDHKMTDIQNKTCWMEQNINDMLSKVDDINKLIKGEEKSVN